MQPHFVDITKKIKTGLELVSNPFSDCQICSVFFSLVIHHLTYFNALIQSCLQKYN